MNNQKNSVFMRIVWFVHFCLNFVRLIGYNICDSVNNEYGLQRNTATIHPSFVSGIFPVRQLSEMTSLC